MLVQENVMTTAGPLRALYPRDALLKHAVQGPAHDHSKFSDPPKPVDDADFDAAMNEFFEDSDGMVLFKTPDEDMRAVETMLEVRRLLTRINISIFYARA